MDPWLRFAGLVLSYLTSCKSPCVGAQELCESRGGRPGLPIPKRNSPHGLWTESNIELGTLNPRHHAVLVMVVDRIKGPRQSECGTVGKAALYELLEDGAEHTLAFPETWI